MRLESSQRTESRGHADLKYIANGAAQPDGSKALAGVKRIKTNEKWTWVIRADVTYARRVAHFQEHVYGPKQTAYDATVKFHQLAIEQGWALALNEKEAAKRTATDKKTVPRNRFWERAKYRAKATLIVSAASRWPTNRLRP